jgi:phosphoenolpyruvate-protein kinase (PTS system EI component)
LRARSVAAVSILEIKEIAKLLTEEEASHIANRALGMDSSQEIEQLLEASYPLKHQ